MSRWGTMRWKRKLHLFFSADLDGKLDLNFLESLGIEDPEVVSYCLWKEKL